MMTQEEIEVEMEHIKQCQPGFELGYAAASFYCRLHDVSPAELLKEILEAGDNGFDNENAGGITWCKEQMENGNER